MKKDRRFYALMGILMELAIGLIYAWGVFSVYIAADFPEWSKTQLSTAYTLFMIFFTPGSLLGGALLSHRRIRTCALVSAALFFLGFLLSAKTQGPGLLYLGFGVCVGTAVGVAYTTVISVVSAYYPDKPGYISGLLMMSYGISSFIVGKIFALVTPAAAGGWRRSFLGLAVLVAVIVALCGVQLRMPGRDPALAAKNVRPIKPCREEIGPKEMITRPSYWLFFLWAMFLNYCGYMLSSQAGSIAREAYPAIGASLLSTAVGLISVANSLSRLLMGNLFDRLGRKFVMYTTCLLFLLDAALLTAALRTESLPLLFAAFLLGGTAYGGIAPSNTSFISSYYGRRHYSANLSVYYTVNVPSAMAGMLGGVLYDVSGSNRITFLVIGILAALAAAACFGIGLCDRRKEMAEQQ